MDARELFSYTANGIESCGGIKVNKTGPVGMNTSVHRRGQDGGSKVSLAGFIFDLMFAYPKTWSAYTNSAGSIYLEFADGTAYLDDGASYYIKKGSNYHQRYKAVANVIHQMKSNSELYGLLQNMIEEVKMTGTCSKDILLHFCDSYYYFNVLSGNNYPTDMEFDSGLEEEVKAAFRSGEFTKLTSVFPSDMMGKSEYDGSIAVAKKAKKAAKKASDFIKDCKDGKYIVAYEWPEQLKGFIKKPDYLDSFEPTPEFEEIVKKIKFRADKILERMDMGLTGADAIGKDALNILLLGKPGTGKTALAYALSAATGMPVCTTAWNKHSEEGEVEGKSRIVDGKPQFVETDSLLFHQFGGIDINEEINLADPSVTMGCLGQKLEYPFIVKKNGYETVVRHPLNVIIGTMNVGTNGSNPLNQALANRFSTPYILDDPTRETFISILEKTSKKSKEVCTWVYDAYEATVDYLKSPDVNEDDICQNLSIRTCLGAITNLEEGQSPRRALINSIVGAVAVVDLEVARNLQRERIESLREPAFEF
ncbi:MAG: AAA family ATPase [Butyrivibrio sp.]|nr:AAA family ATPase [Butyrivibrio sp.]